MNESIIYNILSSSMLIASIIIIILAIKPIKITKLNKGKYHMKDKQGYLKYNQKVFFIFGIICSIISILALFRVVDIAICVMGMSIAGSIAGSLNSKSIKKYTEKS
ncbi:hypothetical protein KPL39_17120 [Clostridium gasigenes]|uniref:hypothetical protein n=1 Tax=Clostridium gasigenes TaxID=94869 RepID=UPI0014386458|nr:hypothetical protein [Clostridium gasigenes]MBU3137965.1 hypothetical protein [Clostridium gasigenes]NKF07951.1 hypothetical protein [Clostridium gasigenes]QSW20672.1 hypothetical protein J1C67_05785 [Clostridium gasigenes]